MNFKITISLSILTGYINYNLSSIILITLITHTHIITGHGKPDIHVCRLTRHIMNHI